LAIHRNNILHKIKELFEVRERGFQNENKASIFNLKKRRKGRIQKLSRVKQAASCFSSHWQN